MTRESCCFGSMVTLYIMVKVLAVHLRAWYKRKEEERSESLYPIGAHP